MRFEHVNSYRAPATEVLDMLTDPGFREEVCQAQSALDHSVQVTGSGVGAEVVISRKQSMAGAPSVATKVVGDTVELVQRESWRTADTADLTMEIPGKPGDLHGTITLRSNADGTTDELFTGEVKVRVPLVGGKLEQLIAELLKKALVREGKVGEGWLRRRQG